MSAFVVKTIDDYGQPIEGIYEELQRGNARMGWSWTDAQDLRVIRDTEAEGRALTADQESARRCLPFLTGVALEDLLFYVHQPSRGTFSIARVEGEYAYSAADNAIRGDFRSVRDCRLVSPDGGVDMYDDIVPSQLRNRLGRPGRISRIHDSGPVEIVVRDLPGAGRYHRGSDQMSLQRIHESLVEILPREIYREFNRSRIVPEVLCRSLQAYELRRSRR